MPGKWQDKSQIITYETYLNVCKFYSIEDIYDETAFNNVVEANSFIESYNVSSGRAILILCSASKYTQQNVMAAIKRVKKRIQLIITNEISHPRVVYALANKFKDFTADICPQRFFLFGPNHKLKLNTIKKYTYDEYIKIERCGIYDDDHDYNINYLNDAEIVMFNLSVKNEFLKKLLRVFLENDDDADLKTIDCAKYLTPRTNVFSFIDKIDEVPSSENDLLIDNSEFVSKAGDDLTRLMQQQNDNDKIVNVNDNQFINKPYYQQLKDMISEYEGDSITSGNIVVINNIIVNYPMVFRIK